MTSRRSAGESSIGFEADGRWHGYVSMGVKRGGKRDRRHVVGRTRAEVHRKVQALQKLRDNGTVPESGKVPTLKQWLEHWLDTIAVRAVRTSTLQSYRSKIEHRIVPAIGHHRLDRLRPAHLDAFYTELVDDGLASATVLQCHRILSRALKVAVQRDVIPTNVCGKVDAPSLVRAEVDPLSAVDARKLLAAATGARNGARWSVALALGLRQGEALGLAWTDVDLDVGSLTVRQALQRQAWRHGCGDVDACGRRAASCPERTGGGLVLVPPKSQAGRRSVALPLSLWEALKAHRSAQLEERLYAGSAWEDFGLVFTQPNGRPIDPAADWRAWKALLAAAGVRDARLHDARHTAATLLLLQGVAPRVAMQILGHSQISLTQNTYQHVVPELAHDAARRVDEALWPTKANSVAHKQVATGGRTPGKSRSATLVGRVGLEPTTEGL